jgi:thiol:disulfide interchange protein DsbD
MLECFRNRRGFIPLPAWAALLFALLAAPAMALVEDEAPQAPLGPPDVPLRFELLASQAVAGETVPVAVIYSIPAGTHLTDTFFTVSFGSEPPLEFGQPVYPAPIVEHEQNIFRGEVPVWTTVTLPADGTSVKFTAKAEYQICTEGEVEVCFAPDEGEASLKVPLVAAGGEWETRVVAGLDLSSALGAPAAESIQEPPRDLGERLQRALSSGTWLAFLIVFLGGVLASLTPCVYPVIPITISYIGGSSKGNPFKGFILSLWFVLGIALTYSILGIVAAKTGSVFGQAMQNVWVNGGIAVLVGAMGLSMAGFFDIQLPSALTSRVGGQRSGFMGPILMGFATGLIAAPCVGPVLAVLLAWVGSTGSMFLGFWMLFTFAIGLGMLFIVLGTFSGAITALPGAGAWMEGVKHVFSIVLFGLAFWFVRNFVPGWLLAMLYGMIIVMALGAWGAFRPLPEHASHKQGLVKGLLLLLWSVGVILAIGGGLRGFAPGLLPVGGQGSAAGAATEASLSEPEWIWGAEAGFAAAAGSGKPVMMDFWALWCAACNELDHKSYSQPQVLALAKKFTSIKMDMTEKSDENQAIQKKYGVVGMPTVIFFDSEGNETDRFFGFKKPAELAAYMERALAR